MGYINILFYTNNLIKPVRFRQKFNISLCVY